MIFFLKKKIKLQILDSRINKDELLKKYKKYYVKKFKSKLDCLIISTAHNEFLKLEKKYFTNILNKKSLIFDVKKKLKIKFESSTKVFTL